MAHFIQQSATSGECGNIALYHAMQEIDRPMSLEAVRKATGITPQYAAIHGIDDVHILRALDKMGVGYVAYEGDTYLGMVRNLNHSLRNKPLSTALVSVQNGNHWAVVTLIRTGKYYVLDSLYHQPEFVFDLHKWGRWGTTFYFIAIWK